MPELKIGLPKGSLQESTVEMFRQAGFRLAVSERSYFPDIDHPDYACILFRAQEMSRYVEQGVVDVGLTGRDWIAENNSDVVEVAELVYSKATSRPARWVLAVPKESAVQRAEDLGGKRIATELVQVTRRFFAERGVDVAVEFSWGATEVKARLLDGIVEITETGSSLRANNLRIVEEIMVSTPRLIASRTAWADEWKREQIENLAMLLRGSIEGREKVGLKFNCPRSALGAATAELPAEKSPTISPLADGDWVAVEVIIDRGQERSLLPKLKRAGASGLIVYPLNQVIP